MIKRKMTGMSNHSSTNKFVIALECGHHVVCDHSVDTVDDFKTDHEFECAVCADAFEFEEEKGDL